MKYNNFIVEKGPKYRRPVGSYFWINSNGLRLYMTTYGNSLVEASRPTTDTLLPDLMELDYVRTTSL